MLNSLRPLRVLLVDDEAAVRVYVSAVLRREGFQVREAGDGAAALALCRETAGAVDILVTDVRMPRMTGTELAAALESEFPGIPVVYISAEPVEPLRSRPQAVFLRKPFLPGDLVTAVREVLLNAAGAGLGMASAG